MMLKDQSSSKQLNKPIASGAWSSTLTLARWRLSRTWFLLLVIALGLIAAVVVACSVPLFSQVTNTAGLRGILNQTPDSSQITTTFFVRQLSTASKTAIEQQTNQFFTDHLGPYIAPNPILSITMGNMRFVSPKIPPSPGGYTLTYYGIDPGQDGQHLHIEQGRLPNPQASELEIIVSKETAISLKSQVGSTVTVFRQYDGDEYDFNTGADKKLHLEFAPFTARIVGTFTVPDQEKPYWRSYLFDPSSPDINTPVPYTLMGSNTGLLTLLDHQAQQEKSAAAKGVYYLEWRYLLDSSRVNINQFDDLSHRVGDLSTQLTDTYGNISGDNFNVNELFFPPFPYLDHVFLFGALLPTRDDSNLLDQFSNRIAITRLPVLVLLIQIIGLILLFVSMMLDLLVERQSDAIALLRSRGASARQIFGALFAQSLGLALLALILGPPLALLVATFFAGQTLTGSDRNAISILSQEPQLALRSVALYALIVVTIALITMAAGLYGAIKIDVLALRREASRSTRVPFWQRFYLDIIAGIIALVAYGVSLYLNTISSSLDARGQALITGPLALLAPFFLVLGSFFLFMRFYSLLLRLAAFLAGQGRGAPSMLALAHMARSPRQSVRMILLLSLATTFAIFSLIFTATQQQHATDLANYELGADMNIPINTGYSTYHPSMSDLYTALHKQPAILSASVGYQGPASINAGGDAPIITLEIIAADANTLARTMIWPEQASSQPLSYFTSQLLAHRQEGLQKDAVPVFVDALLWNRLHLHEGSIISINNDKLALSTLKYLVLGHVEHIPTINDSMTNGVQGDAVAPGGVLADYQTFLDIYNHDVSTITSFAFEPPYINQIWLHTSSDPADRYQLRTALSRDFITNLNIAQDRYQLLDLLQGDPFYLNLIGVLTLGAIIALLLAVIGNLLASLLSVRSRLTSFVILRALGTSPAQVASVLIWEQILIYASALLMGVIFGALLSLTLIPNLVLSNAPTVGILSTLSTGDFYLLQQVLFTSVTLPPSLFITGIVLILTCIIALGLMVRAVSRPAMSQILRLNED